MKTAVITGGASGIGRATALAYLKAGTNVLAIDIDEKGLLSLLKEAKRLEFEAEFGERDTKQEEKILYADDLSYMAERADSVKTYSPSDTADKIQLGQLEILASDIKDPVTAQRAVALAKRNLGGLDILFNNAGHEFVAPLMETTEAQWDELMETNLKGTYLMTKACLAVMLEQGSGVITNNASDAGLRGIRLNAAYSTSKAGIIHLTRSLALDYTGQGIRTNCICPGCIDTPLCRRFNAEVAAVQNKTGDNNKTGEKVLAEFVQANIPMQRVGTAEEVANVVLFLSSPQASYISGAIIPVDGGLTAGM